jgi:hypothetical protein
MNGEVMVEAWKDASERSHHRRIDWAKYLGMPMRRFVYIMREEGKTQAECLIEVKTRVHNTLGYVPPGLDVKAMIGVSAGYSEGSTMEKVKQMEETMENIPETEKVEWDVLEGKEGTAGSKYLSVKPEVTYILSVKSADLYRDNRWKDAQGQPKLKLRVVLESVNKEPANGQVWETGSYTVMKEVRKSVKDGSLARSSFLLKKKDTEGKVTYVFEKIGEKSPTSFNNVGAFL